MTRRSLVLCYHAASASWRHHLSLPPETIEAQVLGLLRRRYRPVSAAELTRGRGRMLHVTFDDAFRSVLGVWPALRRLGVPATVFACSEYAERPRPLAVPELESEVAAQPHELETMGWDELRMLQEEGAAIESHTGTHPHLTRLADDELRRELLDSRERLSEGLGRPCTMLAYPYGEHDGRVRAAARAAGYDAAFALSHGSLADAFALPRVDLYPPDHGIRLFAKTEPVLTRPVRWVRARTGQAPASSD